MEAYADELDTLANMMVGLFHLDLESSFSSLTKILMPQIIISSDKYDYLFLKGLIVSSSKRHKWCQMPCREQIRKLTVKFKFSDF